MILYGVNEMILYFGCVFFGLIAITLLYDLAYKRGYLDGLKCISREVADAAARRRDRCDYCASRQGDESQIQASVQEFSNEPDCS